MTLLTAAGEEGCPLAANGPGLDGQASHVNGEASHVQGDKMQEAIILRDPPTKGVRDFMLSVKVASSAPFPQHPFPGCLCVYPHVVAQ